MGKMTISESTSEDVNYAIVENGKVKVVLNESTKKKGHMPISEAKAFAHSIIEARNKRDKMLTESEMLKESATWSPSQWAAYITKGKTFDDAELDRFVEEEIIER